MALKDNIRTKRYEHSMTLEELAKKVGVSRQTIQRYESGVISNVPSDKIELIAKALNTTPAYLMGWEDIAEQTQSNYKKISGTEMEAAGIDITTNEIMEIIYKLSIENKHKIKSYAQKLYDIQKMDSEQELLLNAAHQRSDIEALNKTNI